MTGARDCAHTWLEVAELLLENILFWVEGEKVAATTTRHLPARPSWLVSFSSMRDTERERADGGTR